MKVRKPFKEIFRCRGTKKDFEISSLIDEEEDGLEINGLEYLSHIKKDVTSKVKDKFSGMWISSKVIP